MNIFELNLKMALDKVTENEKTTIEVLAERCICYSKIMDLFPQLSYDDVDHIASGSKNPPAAKVTSRDVIAISTLRKKGMKYIEIHKIFPEITEGQIGCIARGKHWKHIDRPLANCIIRGNLSYLGERNGNAKLTNHKVSRIRSLKRAGRTYNYISNKYDISKVHAINIVKRKSWGHIA